uniref:RING-type domain-containing protein n=1 Tax=Anopheles farauti TaxID=69004 RepID=A0A182QBA6_9DIPT
MVLLPHSDVLSGGNARQISAANITATTTTTSTMASCEGTPLKVSVAPSAAVALVADATTTSNSHTDTTAAISITTAGVDDVTNATTTAGALAMFGGGPTGPLSPYRPSRVKLGSVYPCITCNLCKGYLIDATTIVECLHSFCHSCIMKHLRTEQYCPQCEMMINKAKPNINISYYTLTSPRSRSSKQPINGQTTFKIWQQQQERLTFLDTARL